VEIDASALGLKNGVYAGEVDVRYLATDARRKIYRRKSFRPSRVLA
jgi:hypothetical protein